MISLPNNAYDAMAFINALANAGHIEGIAYQVAEENGQVLLKAIKAEIKGKMVIRRPGSVIAGGRNVIKGPPAGRIVVPGNGGP